MPSDQPGEDLGIIRSSTKTVQIGVDTARHFAGLPVPVASVWSRFAEETHGTASLLRLIDCFEAALKFLSILSLEAFGRHVHGQESEVLKTRLSVDLQMPSLGHFAAALRDCSAFVVKQNVPAWSSYLQPIGSPASQGAIDGLLSLRNKQRGHGATLDDEPARRLVDDHLPTLIVFLSAISEHPPLRFRRTLEGKTSEPVGFKRPAEDGISATLPPTELLEETDRLLVEHPATGSWLNLGPLLLVEKAAASAEWSFLFYNGSKGGVNFLDYRTGDHRHFPSEDFRALAVARAYPRSQARSEWFLPLISDRTRDFVGRTDALDKLARFAESNGKRALVVVAPPGLGKTTLLARWTERESVLRHFLRENDEQSCTPATVFANLARQAAVTYGVSLRSAKDTESKRWRDELFRILEAVPAERAAPIVILDGLDEAERARQRGSFKEGILDALPEAMQLPGRSRWVLSTRPELLQEKRFADRFSADRAEHLELHRLGEPEVTEFLRVSGHWDVLRTEPLWIAEIVRRSEGSPLYLRLLVEELRAGTFQPGNPDVLPVGLTDFFARVLRSIEESSRLSESQMVSVQKRNAEALLHKLVQDGLISREAGKEFKQRERQRLDAAAGATSLEVLALLVVARVPLATDDMASILDRPADELEHALFPLRTALVRSGEGHWTLFHGAFRDFVASTRASLVALASDRLRRWALRYQEHHHPYALRHLVGHLADGLEPGPEGPRPQAQARDLVRALTDLGFIAARASQNDAAGLLADYDLALSFWHPSSRLPFSVERMPSILESWQCEVVDDVLGGGLERHTDQGSGPVVAALRERAAKENRPGWGLRVEKTPYFPQGQAVPEEWFPTSRPPTVVSAPGGPAAVTAVEAFATFVSANAHQLVAGANVPALAFNSGVGGLVAQAAAAVLQASERPWIERKNRPDTRPGTDVDIRVLPGVEAVCVCPDFRRFATLSRVRTGKIPGVEARLVDLRTGGELAVLRGDVSLQVSLPLASSLTGDRILAGQIVADFGQKCVFTLPLRDLRAVALTPDGRLAAIAKGGFHDPNQKDYVSIWDLESRTEVRVLEQDDPEVHTLAISADGRVLAVGRHYGDLQIWDVARGKRLLTFAEGLHVRAVAMTPDARFVVCGGSSGIVWMIDVSEARVLRQFHFPTGRIDAVALTPDGRAVAAREISGLFCLWDVKTGDMVKSFDAPNYHRQMQLDSEATTAVVGNRIFDLGAALPDPATKPISAALDENAAVVLGLKDGSVVHEAFGASRRLAVLRHEQIDSVPADILAVNLSADGRQVLVAYEGNEILLVDIETGRHRPVVPKATWMRLLAEVFPKKERNAARLRGEDRLPPELREIAGQRRPMPKSYFISHLTLTPDAKVLVTASDGDALRAWAVASGKCVGSSSLAQLRSFAEGEVVCLKPLPNSLGVLFTKFDCSLHIWRFSESDKPLLLLRGPASAGGLAAVAAVSGDGREVVWASAGMPLEIRSAETGCLIRSSQHKVGHVSAVEWLRGGAWLLAITNDQEEAALEIWDADRLLCVADYPLSSRAVKIAAAREDDRFVCCTQDGQFHWLQYHSGR